jgi:hypothetical protein
LEGQTRKPKTTETASLDTEDVEGDVDDIVGRVSRRQEDGEGIEEIEGAADGVRELWAIVTALDARRGVELTEVMSERLRNGDGVVGPRSRCRLIKGTKMVPMRSRSRAMEIASLEVSKTKETASRRLRMLQTTLWPMKTESLDAR